MKLGEAIPNYQAYRNELQDKKTSIYKQYKKTKEKAERTNDEEWIQKAAELELSYKEAMSCGYTSHYLHHHLPSFDEVLLRMANFQYLQQFLLLL